MHGSLSKNIIVLRESLGLSQKDLSELGNISSSTLANIELGKSFRIKSLERIIDLTDVSLENLTKENFTPPRNLRKKLIEKFKSNTQASVILNKPPTIQYSIKYELLKTNFLDRPREINEIRIYLEKLGLTYLGNSIHVALKRMPDLVEIRKHESKGNTNVYLKKTDPLIKEID